MSSSDHKRLTPCADGIINLYRDDLKKVQDELSFLISKQNQINAQLLAENSTYLNDDNVAKILEMHNMLQFYKDKLIRIKKQMSSIHKKTKSLKKRTDYIQEFKNKELQARQMKRNQEAALISSTTQH